jgi:hypothetical protein
MLAFTFLAVLAAVPAADNPSQAEEAKAKLEALKKRLPAVVNAWAKQNEFEFWTHGEEGAGCSSPVLKRTRATSATEAKITIHFLPRVGGKLFSGVDGKLVDDPKHVMVVFLKFYDGLWTTVRFEWTVDASHNACAHYLLDAIDEAAEK